MNRRKLLGTSASLVLGSALRADARATPEADATPDVRVLFIRHAESRINELPLIDTSGQPLPADSGVSYPLTQAGMEQATALGERLRAVDLRAIYTSTRLRAVQTADAIAFAHAMTIELAPEIVEEGQGQCDSAPPRPLLRQGLQVTPCLI